MTATLPIARLQAEVANALGLHMRPADRFVRLAQSFRSDIVVICRDIRANGKSILDLATLAAECGTTLEIEANGPDAVEAVAALADLIVTDLGGGGETA